MARWAPCSTPAGSSFEACFDALNLTRPALVAEIHRAVYRGRRAGHPDQHLWRQPLQAGALTAWRARWPRSTGPGWSWPAGWWRPPIKEVLVAGDVGPLGVRLAPFGRVQPEQARQAFAEQIAGPGRGRGGPAHPGDLQRPVRAERGGRRRAPGLRPAGGRLDDLHPR